jgi:large subunit ribosomal protein L29
MTISELRELSVQELQVRGRDLREQIFRLRIQQTSGQLEKPSELHSIRREIARVETVLTEKRHKALYAALDGAAASAA